MRPSEEALADLDSPLHVHVKQFARAALIEYCLTSPESTSLGSARKRLELRLRESQEDVDAVDEFQHDSANVVKVQRSARSGCHCPS